MKNIIIIMNKCIFRKPASLNLVLFQMFKAYKAEDNLQEGCLKFSAL